MSDAFRVVARRQFVMRRAEGQAYQFRDDFVAWLQSNMPVWEGFEHHANSVYERGRRHYSARTIGEVLRHETALAEAVTVDFKLNNNRWPDLARLYLMLYPEREGFFELRSNDQRSAAA